MNFNNRFEVVSWICKNQLQRKDITEEMHRYLIGKYFEAEKSAYLSTVDSINSECKSSGFQYHIAKRMGKAFSLVASTIYKYELYTKALDNIGVKSERMAEKILSGKLKLSQENTVELSRYSKEEIRKLNNIVTINNINYMNYSEMIRRLKPKDFSASSAAPAERKSNSTVLPIKEIPAYDPDADLSKTTSAAREKLLLKLSDLCKAAHIIQKVIEETNTHGL